jgi:hypothetical protein
MKPRPALRIEQEWRACIAARNMEYHIRIPDTSNRETRDTESPPRSSDMIRMLSLLTVLVLITAACGRKPADEAAPMTVSALLSAPEKFIDKQVVLTGTVTHVCKHGGKRCHLTETEKDQKIRVETGDKVKAFDRALEGSDLKVTGILRETRIDDAYLDSWENEILSAEKESAKEEKADATSKEPVKKEGGEGEEGANMPNGGHVEAQGMDAVNEMRAELKKSGKSYISQWWIECVSYAQVDEKTSKN